MHTANSSTLLPDLFRNKSSRVRIGLPKAILLDFHGTISERRWEDKVIFPYVRQAVGNYLKTNWYNDTIQQCLSGLRNESFEQRFRNKFDDAPVISDVTADGHEMEPEQLINQVSDFLVWQMSNKRETRDTRIIERLIWIDGFKRKQIRVPIFEDVIPCVQAWRTINKCLIYVTSSIEEGVLKLLLQNTDQGDFDKLVDGYLCSKKNGEKLMVDMYKKLHNSLRDLGKVAPKEVAAKRSSKEVSHGQGAEDTRSQGRLESAENTLSTSISTSSESMDHARPILFLTDSGQEAKAASLVQGGEAYECLLVNRPGNRKIRTYYLSRFSYIDKFTDIQFV